MPLARRDPTLLYEISLAIGSSLDPAEAAQTFCETLVDRLSLDGAGVWVEDPLVAGVSPSDRRAATLHRLSALGAVQELERTVLVADRDTVDVSGARLTFPLPRIGVLGMQRGQDRTFTENEAAALREVVGKFSVTLEGALAHRRLRHESAERESAEAESRLAAERLAALIRSSPSAILLEDSTRHVTLANQAFCDLFGIPAPPDAVTGMDCAAAADQSAALFADPAAFIERVDALLGAKERVTGELIEMADGNLLERDYVPFSLQGVYAGHLWEYRDVTAQRRSAREVDKLRQFYEAVLESMPAQLAVFEPDGRYRYVTRSAIGDPEIRKGLIGKTDADYAAMRGLPADVPRRRMQTILDVAASQQPIQFEESFLTKTGETRHFVRFVNPVLREDGTTDLVLGYGLDITDRKAAEQALAASEALKRGVFESALDAVITIDTEGRILEFNPAAEATFGYEVADVVGEVMADLIVPERLRSAHAAGMARYLDTGEGPVLGLRIEVPAMRADGSEFPCELAINPVRLDDDREVFTATLRNITERVAAENALRKSEARLRVALEVADLGTWDRTPEGVGDWDERCRAIFGLATDDDLTYQDILGRIHPDDRAGVQERLDMAHDPASDGVYEAEYRVVWGGGEVRWVAARGLVLFDGDGDARRPARFVGTAQDVTERHLAAEALAESEGRYKQIVENSQDLIYRADLLGRFTYANAVALYRTGRSEEDLLGTPFWDLVLPEYRADVVTFYTRQVSDLVPNTYLEFPVEDADGEVIWIGQNVQLLEEDGVPVGVQAVARDVTERRRVMDELVAARETAERASRAREEFLANMSHEMRTPLNAVLGMGELLRTTLLDSEQRQFLDALSFSADQLLALINDLLDVAKIESGQIVFERVPFRLGEVVDGVAEAMRFRAREKDLPLTVVVDPKLPRHLMGDPVRLSQILLNLLSNAVKFTERGRVRLSVSAVAPSGGEGVGVQFRVEDTGVGIPADKTAAIFERFTQARSDTTRRFGGTGLGLAIVKELTERQGGTVTVESEEGRGTTFTTTITYAVAEPVSEVDLAGDEANLTGVRVLIVEDNPLNHFVARRMLESWGADVTVAENGREGVEAVEVEKGAFDIVLMDVQMPEMDGFEATRRMRALYDSRTLPILALTASALVEQRGQMDAAGMDGLILKPFKPAHLRRAVAAHTGRSGATLADPRAEPTGAEQGALVDLAALTENVGGDLSFVAHLASLFSDLVPEAAQAMEAALAEDDLDGLATAAHKLKSSAGIVGVEPLRHLLGEIERLAGEGQTAPLPAAVEAAIATAAAAVDELSRLLPNRIS